MVKRNTGFNLLNKTYLFPEVMRRARAYENLISLCIGDTSEPIPFAITEAMGEAADRLSSRSGYTGYGADQGSPTLREKISEIIYKGKISADEIFISDGAKCDIGRLQILFSGSTIAVQNPVYPVYVDTGLLLNQKIILMDCVPENDFFPNNIPKADLIYLCSPNNPTGSVATRSQLETLVHQAKEKESFIIIDTAYAGFIGDYSFPRSIYEIEGAEEISIEVSSFSKIVGFTGVRLGWTVVPHNLKYANGGSVREDFSRIISTFFNGASNIAQAGGEAALAYPEEIKRLSTYYLENARLLKKALEPKGFPIYGGENAPFLWVDFGMKESWSLFQMLLEETGLITTPGSGFGSCGEGFLRFSAFGDREKIEQAVKRIETQWPKQLSLSLI